MKLPATILSRTQHFRFRKISNSTLQRHLEVILDREGVKFESEAIDRVVRFSSGSVRDALTLLDQAVIYSKGFLTLESVTNMLGTVNPSTIESLIDSIVDGDLSAVRKFIEDSGEFETETIIDEITLHLKEHLLNGSNRFEYSRLDSLFKHLREAKSLLAIGSDEEFVLAITLFKMVEDVDGKESVSSIVDRDKIVDSRGAVETLEERVNIDKPEVDSIDDRFKSLIDKLYNYDPRLGEVFEKNIEFISFEDRVLTWKSSAVDGDRIFLRNRFGQVRMYLREVYGSGIKIKSIPNPPQKSDDDSKEDGESGEHRGESSESGEVEVNHIEEEKREPTTVEERLNMIKRDNPLLERVMELFRPENIVLDFDLKGKS